MKVCRVCLAVDVKMYHMSEHNLSVMYEQVAGLKINTEDMLPKMLCWECVARLSSAHNFMKKALRTHLILEDKIKSSKFISMGDIDSIDKTELKSSLGVKFYEDNYTDIHIVKESDNCLEESKAEFSEPNFVDIKNEAEQMFVIQNIVSAVKDTIKKEYSKGNEEQTSEFENNIEGDISNESVKMKFRNTEFKTEMLERTVTENVSDEEIVIDNESNNSGMFEEINHLKVETTEVDDLIKQNRKRKRGEALPHCKEPKVVLDNIMLSLNEHNTQDNSQSAKDNKEAVFQRNSSISDPVNVRTGFSDDVSSNKLLLCDKSKHLKRSFSCAHCDFVTDVKSRLIGHVNANHTKNVSDNIVFNCPYCSYNTCFKQNLDRHINTKHTKSNIFNCSYCSYNTYSKINLDRHINSKHTKSTIFKCDFCNYEAYSRDSLTKHVNAKHTKDNVFTCPYCSYKSYQKSNLYIHINAKHTKTKAFHCSCCSYKAYNKILLKRHINAKHTKANVFICSQCNLQLYCKSSLIRHIKAKHC